ncbi:hypothetical protein SK128_025793 [Halocaridina rubra]|uniref:Uncharacterized protein n=1 Tax=Halocaridina rubra TaxID=373956 RepID=A0AAN8XAC2_HALRR
MNELHNKEKDCEYKASLRNVWYVVKEKVKEGVEEEWSCFKEEVMKRAESVCGRRLTGGSKRKATTGDDSVVNRNRLRGILGWNVQYISAGTDPLFASTYGQMAYPGSSRVDSRIFTLPTSYDHPSSKTAVSYAQILGLVSNSFSHHMPTAAPLFVQPCPSRSWSRTLQNFKSGYSNISHHPPAAL